MAERRTGLDIAVITGIVAALIAFLGNVVVTYVQARNQLELESRKHEWDLVSKAITPDLESTTKMLKFYLRTGLVHDDGGKLADFVKNHEEEIPTLPSFGAIACYSHNQEGSSYAVSGNIYVMGIVDGLKGRYVGRIFQPLGYEGKDISADQDFKNQCNARFAACKGACWAGGDTGGFYGYK
jgi:hypothetical protein